MNKFKKGKEKENLGKISSFQRKTKILLKTKPNLLRTWSFSTNFLVNLSFTTSNNFERKGYLSDEKTILFITPNSIL